MLQVRILSPTVWAGCLRLHRALVYGLRGPSGPTGRPARQALQRALAEQCAESAAYIVQLRRRHEETMEQQRALQQQALQEERVLAGAMQRGQQLLDDLLDDESRPMSEAELEALLE